MSYAKTLAHSLPAAIIIYISGLLFIGYAAATPYKNNYFGLSATAMSFNAIISFLLVVSITGFFYGLAHMYRFKREGGIPRKMLEPQVGLSQEAIAARKHALTGVGVFMATLAIMLILTSIFGPA